MKTCRTCNVEKEENEYHKGRNDCKECKKIYDKEYRKKNKKYIKEYYEKNKTRILLHNKKWNDNNKEQRTMWKRDYERNRRNEPEYKLKQNIRNSLKRYFDNGGKEDKRTCDLLGCSYKQFYDWIEFNCILDNLDINTIHIDHVQPLSKYNNNHWSNLFPLTPEDNLSKGDDEPSIEYLIKVGNRRIEFERTIMFV